MRVTLTTFISGTRNGEAWPEVGSVIDLPADEAQDMIANGYAEAVTGRQATAETAVAVPVGETTGAQPVKAPRARKAKA